MSGFLTARIQFEIKYTHILNFGSLYKEVVSPYLKLSSGFTLHNQNTPQEYIQILFEEDNFHIDCRWDRIIFVSEGSLSKFKDTKSSFKIFFEIFEKLRAQSSFGKINNYVALAHGVRIKEKEDFESLVESFQGNFLKSKVNNISAGKAVDDIAIILEFTEGGKDVNLSIGPYDYEKDIDNRNLTPFKSSELNPIKENHGYIMQLKINEVTQEVNFEKVTSFIEIVEKYYSKFDL